MQSYILLGIAIVTTVLSQLFFKRGVAVLGGVNFTFSNVLLVVRQVFLNPFLLGGLFLYGMSFLLWLFVLSKMKLSVAYPITSLNFVFVLLASYYLFGEKLSSVQYVGIILIIIGVFFLAKS